MFYIRIASLLVLPTQTLQIEIGKANQFFFSASCFLIWGGKEVSHYDITFHHLWHIYPGKFSADLLTCGQLLLAACKSVLRFVPCMWTWFIRWDGTKLQPYTWDRFSKWHDFGWSRWPRLGVARSKLRAWNLSHLAQLSFRSMFRFRAARWGWLSIRWRNAMTAMSFWLENHRGFQLPPGSGAPLWCQKMVGYIGIIGESARRYVRYLRT